MMQYEDKNNITPELLNLIVKIGINEKWPVTLGRAMKHFI